MSYKHRIMGWEPSDLETYAEVYHEYGGSINTSPDVVRYFLGDNKLKFKFWQLRKENEIVAAYFMVNEKTLGLNIWRDYPVSFDEIIIPVAPDQKLWLPDKTNRLSWVLKSNIINSSFSFREKRKICLIKDSFSSKTTKKRKGEVKRFFDMGGESYPLKEMSPTDLADLYIYLFKLRFADKVKCYERDKLVALLSALKHMVFGNALFFKGSPCAIDLMLGTESKKMFYFDVPNGGVDPRLSDLSPGSLLMWLNICDARNLCQSQAKKMFFSIGAYEKNWEYKLRWADTFKIGKILMF